MTGVWPAALLGGFVGLCCWVAWRFTFPPPMPLHRALDRMSRRSTIVEDDAGSTFKRRLGARAAPLFESIGLSLDRTRVDARMTGVSLNEHVGSKVTSTFLPLIFVVAGCLLLVLADVSVPLGGVALTAVVSAAIGFVAPDLSLRENAARRRRDFGLAFGSYLDLVAISLAGGMGTEAALVEAARIGDNWAFRLIRRAVDVAQIEGTTVWHTLGKLGEELDLPVVLELAASISLAGNEGAKIRNSVATKADTLRSTELAEAESEAQSATERMAVPTAMLLFGFVILLGYPAVSAVVGGL